MTAKVTSFAERNTRGITAVICFVGFIFWAVMLDDLAAYSNRYTLWFRWTIPLVQSCIVAWLAAGNMLNWPPKATTQTSSVKCKILEKKILENPTGSSTTHGDRSDPVTKTLAPLQEPRYVFLLKEPGARGAMWEQTVTKSVFSRYERGDYYPATRD